MEKGDGSYCLTTEDTFTMVLGMSKLMGNVTIARESLFESLPESFVDGDDLDMEADHVLTFVEKDQIEKEVSDCYDNKMLNSCCQ